jgi:hypothetical protein
MNYYNQIPRELRDYVWVPTDQSAVDGYKFIAVSETKHSRGVSWFGQILKNDKVVCTVENYGDGGSNNYIPVDEFLYAGFRRDAKKTYPNMGEPDDLFVQFIYVISSIGIG